MIPKHKKLNLQNHMITFRIAIKKDVPFIVEMLADDKLGALREKYENPLPQLYYDAFEEINADKNQELVVVEDINQEIIGTLQLVLFHT